MRNATNAFAFLFFVSLLLPMQMVHAQDANSLLVATTTSTKTIRLATVNIYDARIVQQKDSTFDLGFRLNNREGYQPGVKYAVQLMTKASNGYLLVDEQVYPETLTLAEFSNTPVYPTYRAPSALDGVYTLFVVARNDKGLPLGRASFGDVTLKSSTGGIQIIPESCTLRVVGEKGSPKYTLRQGVDIATDETLQLRCDAKNTSSKIVDALPVFRTHFRTAYGEVVPDGRVESEVIKLPANATTTFSVLLPKAEKPQSYDVVTALSSEMGLSNSITAHYVLRGESATVQTATLDRASYNVGDVAQLTFYWSGSADDFPGARIIPERPATGTLAYVATLVDGANTSCAEPIRGELGVSTQIVTTFMVTKECLNPQTYIEIVNGANETLDQQLLTITTPKTPLARLREAFPPMARFAILLLLMIFISFMVVRKLSSRGAGGGTTPPPTLLAVLFLAFFFSFLPTSLVHADTFSVEGRIDMGGGMFLVYRTITFSVNLDNSTYAPGAQIIASGDAVTNPGCSNAPELNGELTVDINSNNYTIHSGNIGTSDSWPIQSVYGTAQGVAGTYQAIFTGGFRLSGLPPSLGSHGIPYTVSSPVIPSTPISIFMFQYRFIAGGFGSEIAQFIERAFPVAFASSFGTQDITVNLTPGNCRTLRFIWESQGNPSPDRCYANSAPHWSGDQGVRGTADIVLSSPADSGGYQLICERDAVPATGVLYSSDSATLNITVNGSCAPAPSTCSASTLFCSGVDQWEYQCGCPASGPSGTGWLENPAGVPAICFNRLVQANSGACGGGAPPACGPAAKDYLSSDTAFAGAFCTSGSPSPAVLSFPIEGGATSWTCGVTNCTATRQSSGGCPSCYYPGVSADLNATPGNGLTIISGQSTNLRAYTVGGTFPQRWIFKDPTLTPPSAPTNFTMPSITTARLVSLGYGTAIDPLAGGPGWGTSFDKAGVNYDLNTGPLFATTRFRLVAWDMYATWNPEGDWGIHPPLAYDDVVVTVLPPGSTPDLVAGLVSPTTVMRGVSTTFTAPVTNQGVGGTGSGFSNRFERASQANGGGTIATFGSTAMGALSPGGAGTHSAARTYNVAGTYSIRACADHTAVIPESDEANNCGPWTNITVVDVSADDAQCVSITGVPATIAPSTPFSAQVTVRNFGTNTWTPGVYNLGDVPHDAWQFGWSRVGISGGNVLPNNTVTFTINAISPATLGSYTFGASMVHEMVTWIPVNGALCSAPITVVSQPDLSSGVISPVTAVSGVASVFTAQIANNGSVSTGVGFNNSIQWATLPGGAGVVTTLGSVAMGAIPNGHTSNTSQAHTFVGAGTYSMRACADTGGAIAEANEGNNCGPWTNIVVSAPPAQPDLVVGAVAPNIAIMNTAQAFSAQVVNLGLAGTGAGFQNYIQWATQPGGAGVITTLGSVAMGALGNGATQNTSQTHTFTSAGTFSMRACADTGGAIAEANEGNNCGAWTNIVVSPAGYMITSSVVGSGGSISPLGLTAVPSGGNQAYAITPSGGYSRATVLVDGFNQPASVTSGAFTFNNVNANHAISVSFVARPDLTVGAVTPVTAQINTATLFSAPITNSGAAGTGAGFQNYIQWATQPGGAGVITTLGSVAMGALGNGATQNTSQTHTFTSIGTFSMRACADTGGAITESDDGNNCGAWTNIVVSAGSEFIICPRTATVMEGDTVQFRAYYDPTPQNRLIDCIPPPLTLPLVEEKTTTVTWSSFNNSIATVSDLAGSKGLARGQSANIIPVTIRANMSAPTFSDAQLTVIPAARPDLTVGAVTPVTAQINTATLFSAPITNSGAAGTGAGFQNYIQWATQPGGAGVITTLGSVAMGALGNGATQNTSQTHTFTSIGTFSMRACADTGGAITESDDGNNCGAWTNIVVSASSCPAGNQSWTVGARSCSAAYNVIASGSTELIADTTGPEVGVATVRCTNGAITVDSGSTCYRPTLLMERNTDIGAVDILTGPKTATLQLRNTGDVGSIYPAGTITLFGETLPGGVSSGAFTIPIGEVNFPPLSPGIPFPFTVVLNPTPQNPGDYRVGVSAVSAQPGYVPATNEVTAMSPIPISGEHDFGSVRVGKCSTAWGFAITNVNQTYDIPAGTLNLSGGFYCDSGKVSQSCAYPAMPNLNDTHTVNIYFCPNDVTNYNGSFTMSSYAGRVEITGTGRGTPTDIIIIEQ